MPSKTAKMEFCEEPEKVKRMFESTQKAQIAFYHQPLSLPPLSNLPEHLHDEVNEDASKEHGLQHPEHILALLKEMPISIFRKKMTTASSFLKDHSSGEFSRLFDSRLRILTI
jgi:hypothetical protein